MYTPPNIVQTNVRTPCFRFLSHLQIPDEKGRTQWQMHTEKWRAKAENHETKGRHCETTFLTSLDIFKISDEARVQGDDRRYDVVSRQTTGKASPPRATASPTFSGSQERSWRIRRSRNASHAGKYIITHSQATPFARSPGYKSANAPAMLATPPPTLSPAILSHYPIPVCLSPSPHRLLPVYPPFPFPDDSPNGHRAGISSASHVRSAYVSLITFPSDGATKNSIPERRRER